jgi:hypothetical protein
MLVAFNGRETVVDSSRFCASSYGIWVKRWDDRRTAHHFFPSACVRRHIGTFDDLSRVTPAAGGQNSNTHADGADPPRQAWLHPDLTGKSSIHKSTLENGFEVSRICECHLLVC